MRKIKCLTNNFVLLRTLTNRHFLIDTNNYNQNLYDFFLGHNAIQYQFVNYCIHFDSYFSNVYNEPFRMILKLFGESQAKYNDDDDNGNEDNNSDGSNDNDNIR